MNSLDIARSSWKTAIRRGKPSRVAKALKEAGGFYKKGTLLDYGCGHGEDIFFYRDCGMAAEGYDPGFEETAEKPRGKYNVVSMVYVLNVLPKSFRKKVLLDAYSYVRPGGYLAVAVRARKEISEKSGSWARFDDGYITKSGSFQKGYTESSLSRLCSCLKPVRMRSLRICSSVVCLILWKGDQCFRKRRK